MESAADSERHGQILCGTISVGYLDRSIALYRDFLSHDLVETGQIDSELAQAWGAENLIGARYALIQPQGGEKSRKQSREQSFIRLLEQPQSSDHQPAKSLGWNAFEITVKDVFALADHLQGSDFQIVGPPKLVDGFTSFIPMQVYGPDGEVLFLNQVNHSDEDCDLPISKSPVGEIFIVVVASPDREISANEHAKILGLDRAATHELRYSLINRAFELPEETKHQISMVQNGRMPFGQIDQYPEGAEFREQQQGWLPAGNSMVSVLVDSIDKLPIAEVAVGPSIQPKTGLYRGRKTQLIRGSASELIELIEIGSNN